MNGGFVGPNSFISSIKGLLSKLASQKFDSDINFSVAKGSPNNLNVIRASLVSNVSFTTVGYDHKLNITFENDLPNDIYSYEFNIKLSSAKSFDVYVYGESGGAGFDASALYQFWSWDQLDGYKAPNKTRPQNVNGGYFHRASGKKIQITGSFRNHCDHIQNRGKPYSLDYEVGGTGLKGKTYEFLVQPFLVEPLETKFWGES